MCKEHHVDIADSAKLNASGTLYETLHERALQQLQTAEWLCQ